MLSNSSSGALEINVNELGKMNNLSRVCTKDMVMQIVHDEIESAKQRIWTRIKRYYNDGEQSSADHRSMKLKFTNKISDIILTSEEIKGLEVALVDGSSEKTVDVGPEASARVEILLLKGQSDDEDFDHSIVPEIRGKKPLLDGDVAITLERGVGVVQNVKVRNHAIEIKPPVFKLGARVVDEFRVKEAKTESFTVKDYRKKYHTKHPNPSLSDEVHRLCNIAKGGEIDKRLRLNQIKTVEDFLVQLLINRHQLKNIVNMGQKKWEDTVNNARRCSSETRMYCYMDFDKKKGVVFNVFGQALGLYVESHFSPMNTLPEEEQKAYAEELLASAYNNWRDVRPFDDLDSLHQHVITCLSNDCHPENPLNPNCPVGDLEMMGESSSRRSYASFHSVSSAMNSGDVDNETMYDAAMILPPNVDAWVRGFDEFLQENEQLKCPVNGASADEESGTFDLGEGEGEVAQTSDSLKRWKNLLSRWFSFKKRDCVDVAPHCKKHKIG